MQKPKDYGPRAVNVVVVYEGLLTFDAPTEIAEQVREFGALLNMEGFHWSLRVAPQFETDEVAVYLRGLGEHPLVDSAEDEFDPIAAFEVKVLAAYFRGVKSE